MGSLRANPRPRRDQYTWTDARKHYEAHEYLALSESTRRGYKGVLNNPAFKKAWDGRKMKDITYTALVAYFGQLGRTRVPAMLHQHRSVLQQVLKSVGPHGKEAGLMIHAMPMFPDKVNIGKQGWEPSAAP